MTPSLSTKSPPLLRGAHQLETQQTDSSSTSPTAGPGGRKWRGGGVPGESERGGRGRPPRHAPLTPVSGLAAGQRLALSAAPASKTRGAITRWTCLLAESTGRPTGQVSHGRVLAGDAVEREETGEGPGVPRASARGGHTRHASSPHRAAPRVRRRRG